MLESSVYFNKSPFAYLSLLRDLPSTEELLRIISLSRIAPDGT